VSDNLKLLGSQCRKEPHKLLPIFIKGIETPPRFFRFPVFVHATKKCGHLAFSALPNVQDKRHERSEYGCCIQLCVVGNAVTCFAFSSRNKKRREIYNYLIVSWDNSRWWGVVVVVVY
jgi:hypothetical protein